VLVATDLLSEGQNLQDCHIVVNFDLPWAIIRLIQRAGRVDRIGQLAHEILCYTFWPMDGVNNIISLRDRVRTRLKENAEVVGADEAFFEDDLDANPLFDLYHEKAGIMDGNEDDSEVDLGSYAYQIFKNATDSDPALAKTIADMPDVVYSAKHDTHDLASGAIVYVRTPEDSDALAYVDADGNSVTESQYEILRIAECDPDTPALPRPDGHHKLVRKAVDRLIEEERAVGGQLGRPSGARHRTYMRLKNYLDQIEGDLLVPNEHRHELSDALEELYKYPLRETAARTLNRQLSTGIEAEQLADLVLNLRKDGRLCIVTEEQAAHEPRIICSLGMVKP
jgi:hypothetical protein